MQELRHTASWAASQNPARAVARATGKHVSTVYRERESGGIEYESLKHVEALARGEDTTPGVWIESLRVEARRAAMEHKATESLVEIWHRYRNVRVPQALVQAQVAEMLDNRADAQQAWTIVGSLVTEMNGMDCELERRGVDPRDYMPSGHRRIR